MVRSRYKYISNTLVKRIEEELKEMKQNKRFKDPSFVKASERIARRL